MVVKRLDNLPSGFSQWEFLTENRATASEPEKHTGYLYRDNRPPHLATEFWGTVELPISGIIESLTQETAAALQGYEIPEDPDGCPPEPAP
jgi:hypothetical protein